MKTIAPHRHVIMTWNIYGKRIGTCYWCGKPQHQINKELKLIGGNV